MKKIFSFGILLAMLMCVTGCSLLAPRFDCKFDNWTSRTVYVTNIEGGSPSSVTIAPWGDETVSIQSDKISFTYSPSNYVYSDIKSSTNTVYFWPRN